MKSVRDIINETLRLVSEGNIKMARSFLERAMSEAAGDRRAVAILARHAAVLAEQAGELASVRRNYELAAAHDPDPWLFLALGDVCRRLGEHEAASSHYVTGSKLANDYADADVLVLLKERISNA
jgi:tetratricopeptide (TPR) repeat protein